VCTLHGTVIAVLQWCHGVVVVGYGVGPSSPWVWGGGGPSLLLVLGCGGSSPHLHVLIDLLGLVTWPSDSVSWRSWAVAAIDAGHRCHGCGVVVSLCCHWCWVVVGLHHTCACLLICWGW